MCRARLQPAPAPLFFWCRLPPSMAAPHERSGLSPAQYSLWLDSHSQEEAVRGLQVRGRLVLAPACAGKRLCRQASSRIAAVQHNLGWV